MKKSGGLGKFVLAIAVLATFLGSFELSDYLLPKIYPPISPGLKFILAGVIAFAVITLLEKLIERPAPVEPNEAQESEISDPPNWLPRPLERMLIAVAFVGMLTWFPAAYIETNALSQPDHPAGVYTVPVHVKSVIIRYMTPTQAAIYEACTATFVISAGVAAIIGLRYWYFRKRKHDA